MTSLNRQRANIVFSTLLDSDPELDLSDLRSRKSLEPARSKTSSQSLKALTPAQVAKQEHIFPRDGALEWTSTSGQKETLGTASIGISLTTFLQKNDIKTPSFQTSTPFQELTTLFTNEPYLLTLTPRPTLSSKETKWHASILLKNRTTVQFQQKAWMHALLAAKVLSEHPPPHPPAAILDIISNTLTFLNHRCRTETYASTLTQADWSLDISALETKPGRRVTLTFPSST